MLPLEGLAEEAVSYPLIENGQTVVQHPEWKRFFDERSTAGTAVLYDCKANRCDVYDSDRAVRRYTPASTFKIPHSLIALETGVVQDERQPVFHWDGTKRDIVAWNRDQTLRTAIKYSVVWVYQEIARQVGAEREARFVRAFDYGNGDTSGPVDQFWLGGPLQISAFEQVAFLKKLVGGQLPVSERSVRIVRDILINDAGPTYVLRAKTGADFDQKIGWWVGWVEKDDDTYLFAVNIDFPEMSDKRQAVTRVILRAAGVLPPEKDTVSQTGRGGEPPPSAARESRIAPDPQPYLTMTDSKAGRLHGLR